MATMSDIPDLKKVGWSAAKRVVSSRFPPIAVFERAQAPNEGTVTAIEGLTNPRLRQDAGEICLLPDSECVWGEDIGAGYIMAPFCHLNNTRFSDGSFGVFYAAENAAAAHKERVSAMERFYKKTQEDRLYNDFRVLSCHIEGNFHNISENSRAWKECHHPSSYAASQALGGILKTEKSNGLLYKSVRSPKDKAIAVLRPKVIKRVIQTNHVKYDWDGKTIARIFDYSSEKWLSLEGLDKAMA